MERENVHQTESDMIRGVIRDLHKKFTCYYIAEAIDVGTCHLSLVLNGHRPMTKRLRKKLCDYLISEVPKGNLMEIEKKLLHN